MLNKLFSLLIRCGITLVAGWAVGGTIAGLLWMVDRTFEAFSITVAIVIWILGATYSLLKFNAPYNIVVLKNT